jgi:beta-glucosidase
MDRMPLKELKGFKRVTVAKGEEQTISIKIPVKELQKWDMTIHGWKTYTGNYKLLLGGDSENEKLKLDFTVNK